MFSFESRLGIILLFPLLKSHLKGVLQILLLPQERLMARALSRVVESWAKYCCWADADMLGGLYLLGKNARLLKKFLRSKVGFVSRKKNIVCISLTSVLRTSIKDGDESNSS